MFWVWTALIKEYGSMFVSAYGIWEKGFCQNNFALRENHVTELYQIKSSRKFTNLNSIIPS